MKDVYFALIANEYTDISNKEQLILCLRWVDDNLTVHEDFFGFYNIPDISSNTIAAAIKDILTRMNLSLENCRGQCYDSTSNMLGRKSGVATQILKIQPKAFVMHCFAHSLSLSVKDVTESCKSLSNAMSTASEIVILIKYSPKRENLLAEIKINLEEKDEAAAGLTTLNTTRWKVRSTCFQRILDNYSALLALWNECLRQGKLQTDVCGRIIGCKAQMTDFDFFFGLNLGILLYRHTDNLSKTLQAKKMSAINAYNVATLTKKVLINLRSDEAFQMFYKVGKNSKKIDSISEPKLQRKRRAPARFEIGEGEPAFHETVEDKYRQIYFEAVDLPVSAIENRLNSLDSALMPTWKRSY